MTWVVEPGLAIGYKNRTIATLTEKIVFESGQTTLLLGLNGQGKTTLMKTLAGLLPPLVGKLSPARALYLADDVDFPANLTPQEILRCLDPQGNFRTLANELFEGLQIENKRYSQLSKGNRQKARILFGEIISSARRVAFLGLDEPLAGLDFQARDYLAHRWQENSNHPRHLLFSMHPSEIPMEPSQILLVSERKIWTTPPATPWSEIKMLLQKPHLVPV